MKWIIALAPFGILGLVAHTVAETGFATLAGYARILLETVLNSSTDVLFTAAADPKYSR